LQAKTITSETSAGTSFHCSSNTALATSPTSSVNLKTAILIAVFSS